MLIFSANLCNAQQFLHREFGVSEGLENPYVYALTQDANRFIWIGTAEGLFKYDGKIFTPFYTRNGLASNFIYSICIDAKNKKWLGHDDGSITVYDDQVFNKRPSDSNLNSRINKIVAARNRKVLICTQSNGIVYVNEQLVVSRIPFFEGDEIIWDVAELAGGHLIVCSDQGVFLLPFQNGKYQAKIAIKEFTDLSALSISKAKIVGADFIIGTEYDGIFTVQVGPKLSLRVKKLLEENVSQGDQLYFANFDDKDELWVSRHTSGITKNAVENQLVSRQKSYWQENFRDYYIKSFLLDAEGNYWLGTYGNGIVQLTNNIFLLSNPPLPKGETLKVKALAAKGDSVLLSNGKDFFVYFNQEYSKIELKNLPKGRKTPLLISCIFYDRPLNKILIGTTDFGILEYDERTKSTKHWYYDELANNINQIVLDKALNIWIATANGACKYDSQSKAFRSYVMQDGLAHNNIHAIFADKKNRIWFATHGSGLSYLEAGKFKFIPTPFKSKPLDGNCFAETGDGTLWVGTDGDGIVCYKDTTVTNYITKQNGLLSNFCYTLATSEKGDLWAGHKNGLSEISQNTQKIYTTANSDLLQEVEMYLNAVAVNKQVIWYGTDKGLLKYNPLAGDDKLLENKTLITGIKVFFNHPDSSKYKYFRNALFPPDNLQFSAKDNHITIEYVGICLKDPNKVMYRYYLEGYDETWTPETNLSEITYSNLSPGQYTFHLVSMNQNGVWNKTPTTYHFEIVPPFYKTWWFYMLSISVLLLAIIAGFTYRTNQLHKKNEFLEGEKLKLESEILQRKMTEQKLKRSEIQLQKANEELNTFIWRSYHDLRGPLKTIQGLVYVALSETEKKIIVSYLGLINETSAKLDSLLQQFSKVTEVRRSKVNIELINIEEVLNASIVSVFKDHKKYDCEIIQDIKINGNLYFDKNFIFSLFHHLLENAVLYAKDAKPLIKVKIRQYGSQLRIIMSDEGIGIQPAALPKIFDMFYKGTATSKGYGLGLYISEKIVGVFDGSINIFTDPDQGTTVVVRLKNQTIAIADSQNNGAIVPEPSVI